ncbi:hypothetical protein ACIPY0_14495 [Paenarthrobacter nicotinovorans]|uniref:hypothetical protein n=1 Tax=Paenarthrobacter nicotinovorans TaxID=29320 RepID=UPI00380D0CFF
MVENVHINAPKGYFTFVGKASGQDLEPLFIEQWHLHIALDLHLQIISSLGKQLKVLDAQLNDTVAATRADDLPGTKRQSLHNHGAREPEALVHPGIQNWAVTPAPSILPPSRCNCPRQVGLTP